MRSELFKKISIFLMLGLLIVSAFFIRLDNFKNSPHLAIDEVLYSYMARQVLNEGYSGYHTVPYGKKLSEKGRHLPEYFSQPLFKHPPVFTFLAALSMKIFGPNVVSAEYVSLLLGVLMIPLIYLLGAQVYDRWVGIFSALFLWVDPISIICSQKVWMDSTIAFLTLLTALIFVYGLKRKNDWYFILSGITSGLLVNTKYTGFLITLSIVLFCLIYRKDLFRNKKFQFSLMIPFLMLGPWFYWNYKVYGIASIFYHSELRALYTRFVAYLPIALSMAILAAAIVFLINRFKKKRSSNNLLVETSSNKKSIRYFYIFIPIILFALTIPEQLIHSIQFTYLPTHAWRQQFFSGEPLSFYFGRLIEFSPLYIFSLSAALLYDPTEKKEAPFIRFCAVTILFFFVFWGNFQSRYILSSLPFFIILGVQMVVDIYRRASASQSTLVFFGGRVGVRLIFAFIITKCYYINVMMSYPNNMCYF